MGKKKLILHIGTHKTATTTIQNALAAARNRMAEQGIWFAHTDREPFPRLNKHCSTYRAVMSTDAAFDMEFSIFERELEDSGCETLLLSEEGFSEAHYDNFAKFGRLTERFDLSVICLLRRQDQFLESVWNQYCREGHERQPIHQFVTRPVIARRARYVDLLDFWSQFATVVPIAFEQARAEGIVRGFGQQLGVELTEPDTLANVSPGMNCAAAMALLNRFEHEYDARILLQAFGRDRTRHALGSLLRTEILEGLAEHNAELKRKYGIEFDNRMPQEPEQSLRLPRPAALAEALNFLIRRAGESGTQQARG